MREGPKTTARSPLRILLLNQTFHPDTVATAQYLSDLARSLAERGHTVTAISSRRAYDDPARTHPPRETWRGVDVIRIANTGLGKSAKWKRAVDFASYLLACATRLLFLRKHDVVIALTSPPLISFLGACWAQLKGARFIYWVMDLNPDEAIAAGWLRPESTATRLLDWISRYSLRHAARVIALDRFMQDRLLAKGVARDRIQVIPPGPRMTRCNSTASGANNSAQSTG